MGVQKPTLFIRASHRTNCFICYGMSRDKTPETKAYRVHTQQSTMDSSNLVKLYNVELYSSTLPCEVNPTSDATRLLPLPESSADSIFTKRYTCL